MSVETIRDRARERFEDIWDAQKATVERPTGTPTLDPETETYSNPTTTVATDMVCSLVSRTAPETRDVAGDPVVLTRLELRHAYDVTLRVDDRVTFTAHPNADLVGETFFVVGVGETFMDVAGLAIVQRDEPDSGS